MPRTDLSPLNTLHTDATNPDSTADSKEDSKSEKDKDKESESDVKRSEGASEIGVVNMAYYVSLGFLTSAGSGESTNLIEVREL
jgi:hypothetical protein